MGKFKVGDRVKCIENYGEVLIIDDYGGDCYYAEDQFEPTVKSKGGFMQKKYTAKEVDELIAYKTEQIAGLKKELDDRLAAYRESLGFNPYKQTYVAWSPFGAGTEENPAGKLSAYQMIKDIHEYLGVNYDGALRKPTLAKPKKDKPAAKKKTKTKK